MGTEVNPRENPVRANTNIVVFLATLGYLGKLPVAPGTFGAAAGLLLCYPLSAIPVAPAVVFVLLFAAGAVWVCGAAEIALGRKDPRSVVIDEAVGMMVTLMGLPFTVWTAVAGFVLFRFFDILKPFPVWYLERRVPGGLGVVIDDVAAGVLAHLALRVLLLLMYVFG
jgi:phosphatidylglycerophosphatase A